MAIRYDKKLEKEINRTIKNFNQKIDRLEKEEKALYLPEKITKKELKEDYLTRTDLRRKLRQLQRFGERGAEKLVETEGGAILSKYELDTLKEERRRILYNINREIKLLGDTKIKIAGKVQDVTFKESSDENYLNLVERYKLLKRNISNLTQQQFERYRKLLNKSKYYSKYYNTKFYGNYLRGLEEVANFYNIDPNILKDIKSKLVDMKKEDFLKLYDTDKAIQSIMHYYRETRQFGNMKRKKKARELYNNQREEVMGLFSMLSENIDNW